MLLRRAVLAARGSIRCRRDVLPLRQFSSSVPRRGQIEITIDGKKVMVEQGAALIQACEIAGVQIPR
jgi:NADH dehydrogenase (ubiquinone) Fe-S protein 1